MDEFFSALLDRYGVGVTFGVVACLFFYKKVWPRIDQLIDTHLAFVGSCDQTNKQQAGSIEAIREGQQQTNETLGKVCTNQEEMNVLLKKRIA